MINFVVFNKATGEIKQTGQAVDFKAAQLYSTADYEVIVSSNSNIRPHTHFMKNGYITGIPEKTSDYQTFNYQKGEWEDLRTETNKAKDAIAEVQYKRSQEYPDVTDQLDMLWHAMDAGTLPKIEPMYSQIKAVKMNNPKP